MKRSPKLIDMTGRRIGRLTVIREAAPAGPVRWMCLCDCGERVPVLGSELRQAAKRGSPDYSCPACRNTKGKTKGSSE